MSDRYWLTRVFPYRPRWVHRAWAGLVGYFWISCPLCDDPFGGHEWRDVNGKPSCIPDEEIGGGSHKAICPACTATGRGFEAPLEVLG